MFFKSLKQSIRDLKEETRRMFSELEADIKEVESLPKNLVMEETVTETKHPDGSVTITKIRRYRKKG